MSRRVLIVALFATLLVPSGCVTLSKYNALKKQVESIETQQDEMAQSVERDEQRIENLHARMKESSDDLRRTGASRGATLDELRMAIAELGGKLEELSFRLENQRQQLAAVLDVLDEKLGTSLAVASERLPDDKDALFRMGAEEVRRGNADKARAVFRAYLKRYPQDERADDAQLLIGESYFLESKYDLAIREFQAVHDQHGEGDMVAKALSRIADALVAQKECAKAKAVLKYLRDTQRKSPEAETVPQRLEELKDCK